MYARDGPFHHSQFTVDSNTDDDSILPTPAATFFDQAFPTENVLTTSNVQTTTVRTSPTLLTIGRSTSAPQSSVTSVIDGSANLSANEGITSQAMSDGAIAAAVVVPLFILSLLAAILFILWKKKSKAAIPDMAEHREHYTPVPPPVASYYTGLDPDHAGSDEPPPYVNKAAVPLIAEPVEDRSETSASWRTADPGLLAPEAERQSVSSTGYSDNVSIHSAKAARMSSGAIISHPGASRDPFDDPESPVSSIDGDEPRQLQNPDSRAVSPVSSSR